MPKKETFTDQLRRLIEECGETRYKIANETGVDASVLCRFMSGERGLTLRNLDKLAEYFGWRIVAGKRPRKGS